MYNPLLSLLSKLVSFSQQSFGETLPFFVLLAVCALLFYKPSSLLSLQRVSKALSHCLTYYVSLNVTFYGLHYWSDSSRCEPLYSRVFIYTHLCLPTPFWRSYPPRTTSKPSRSALPIHYTRQKNANETVDPSAIRGKPPREAWLNSVSSRFQDYCASKFGAIGFHESLSHEIKASEKDGIKMTLVCPYLVDTGMFRGCRIR